MKKILKITNFFLKDLLFKSIYISYRWIDKRVISTIAFVLNYSGYSVQSTLVKSIRYSEIKAKVNIRSYFDYWRIGAFEKHAIKNISKFLDLAKNKKNKLTYYEIGANVGYSVLIIGKMLQERGEVVAFEVESANFNNLVNNIQLNQLDNITPLPLGVSEKTSIEKFYFNRYHDPGQLASSGMGMHSLEFDNKVHSKASYQRVPLMSLDKIVEIFSLPFPTHIFIDAYGAEDNIIRGMKNILLDQRLKMVMIDIENSELSESYCNRQVIKSGFKLVESIVEYSSDVVPKSFKTTYERIQ